MRVTRTYFQAPTVLAYVLLATPAFAQQPAPEEPSTRAEAIAEERADKVAELWPERQSPIVNTVNGLVERGFKEGLDSGRGVNGPQIVLGGMRPGQGFTAGLGYRQSDLWQERLGFRTTARGTFQGAYLFDADLDFQGLRTERTSLRWYTKFESSPDIDYYGPGNTSPKEDHTSFAYEDLTTDFDAAWTLSGTSASGSLGGTCVHIRRRATMIFRQSTRSSRRSRFPASGRTRISPESEHSWTSIFATRGRAPGAAACTACGTARYWDVDSKEFAFRQTEFEFQQYLPYFNKGRVVAVRSAIVLSFPKEGNQLPVYLQPVLGGNDDLRGFGGYRFRDNHSVYVGVEHRWHASSNLEMAAFIDAGKVVPLKRQVDPTNLHYSGGIGFRVRVRSAIVSRIDFAASAEGFRVVWTFSDIYKTKW